MTFTQDSSRGFLAAFKRFVFGEETAQWTGAYAQGTHEPPQSVASQPSADYLFSALDEAATAFLSKFTFHEMQRLQFKLKSVEVHVPAHLGSLASWLLQTPAEARREAAVEKLRALDREFRLDLTEFAAWHIRIGDAPAVVEEGAVVEELHVYGHDGAGPSGIRFAFVGELHNHASMTRAQLRLQHEVAARKSARRTSTTPGHSLTYRFANTGEMRTLSDFPVQVGSSDEADVQLRGQAVSRLHAVFEIGPNGQLGVRDTSTNGTWLNGTRLRHNEFQPLGARGRVCLCAAAGDPRSIELQYSVSSAAGKATELVSPLTGKTDTTPVIGDGALRGAAQRAGELTIEKWFGDGHMVREAASLPHVLSHGNARVRFSAAGQAGYVLAELQAGEASVDGAPAPRFFVLPADGRRSLSLRSGCSIALKTGDRGGA